MQSLGPDARLRLMKFVCSFVWADLEVRDTERAFVAGLVERLDLGEDEVRQVGEWLQRPPPPEEVDPTSIPVEHRKLFVEAIEQAMLADDEVSPEERENLSLFKQLLS